METSHDRARWRPASASRRTGAVGSGGRLRRARGDSRQRRCLDAIRRAEESRTEFVTLSFWEWVDAIRTFAGDDIEAAVLYPEDERYLIGESTIIHYQVADQARPRPDGGDGDA